MPDPRFLVVRLGSLGDIVHTFPAIAALRETFPAAQITWLTHPRWESLVTASDLASEVWAADTRSVKSLREIIQRIRAAKFTKAIDYQGLWKSAALPLLAGWPRASGFPLKRFANGVFRFCTRIPSVALPRILPNKMESFPKGLERKKALLHSDCGLAGKKTT